MFHISNNDSLKSVYLPYFHSVIKYEKCFLVIHLTLKGIYFTKKSGIWLVKNLEVHTEILLQNNKFYLFHANIHLH